MKFVHRTTVFAVSETEGDNQEVTKRHRATFLLFTVLHVQLYVFPLTCISKSISAQLLYVHCTFAEAGHTVGRIPTNCKQSVLLDQQSLERKDQDDSTIRLRMHTHRMHTS